MVVEYPSGSEGSWINFLTVAPRVVFWWEGSVLPCVFPQLFLTIGFSIFAMYLEQEGKLDAIRDIAGAFDTVGVLLAFLTVFKTQAAYDQFWQATHHTDGLLQVSRAMAMSVVTVFKEVADLDVRHEARRIVRLLALHYFVVLEYFQRTGGNAVTDNPSKDRLRADIMALSGNNEFKLLYPLDEPMTSGSDSQHKNANPTVVLLWIQSSLGHVLHADACPAPIISSLQGYLNELMGHFYNMNKIDKTQFPLPYEQIVKIVTLLFVFLHPFVIVHVSGFLTPFISVIVAIGFFGLDEVAEVLESPFGNDPNDINLRRYGRKLVEDLSMIHTFKNVKLDTVFQTEDEFNLATALDSVRLKKATSWLSTDPITRWATPRRQNSTPV